MEYTELPEKVRENVPEPDPDGGPWHLRHTDAGDIPTTTCAVCDDDLFRVPHDDGSCWHCGVEVCWVNDHGEMVHGEHVGDPGAPEIGYNLALDDDDDASHIMCGYCEERFGEGNTVVVITPDGETFGAAYDGPVIRDASPYGEGNHSALYEASDEVWDLLKELVLGGQYVSTDAWRGYQTGPSEAGELVKVSGGWHGSMERSELSDRINTLTSGDYHTDDPEALDFPVAVMFGRTSNVMSIGIDVYAPEDSKERLKEVLDASASPGHAGLR